MLNIYDAGGHLDRGKVLDELDHILDSARTLGTYDRAEMKRRLADLTDECGEGYTHNPLDAPTMVTDYINACKPAPKGRTS